MSERKYTISEIDRMRNAIAWSYPSNVTYYQQERDSDIEQRLRTYMMNGTDPEELEKLANDLCNAEWTRQHPQEG